jgi:uncharacterized secreted protein with C-terminal beta-propeller domain
MGYYSTKLIRAQGKCNMKTHPISVKEAWPTQWKLIALVTLAVWLLVACGGGAGAALPSTGAQPEPTAERDQERAQLANSKPGDLTQYIRNKLMSNPYNYAYTNNAFAGGGSDWVTTAASLSASGASAAPSAPIFSGTTVQEEGVDEADWVKTDGTQLFALHNASYVSTSPSSGTATPARLTAQSRLGDGQLTKEVSLPLPDRNSLFGMYLSTTTQNLAVLSQEYQYYAFPAQPSIVEGDLTLRTTVQGYETLEGSRKAVLDIVPAQSKITPKVAQTLKIDGTLVGSRLIGKHLYVVTQWSPSFASYYATTPQGITLNTAKLSSLTHAEILPTIKLGTQTAKPLLAETDCFVQQKNASPDIMLTSITAIDLSTSDLKQSSKCFAGGANAIYVSSKSIYLSSSRYYSYSNDGSIPIYSGEQFTDIHKFSMNASAIAYVGSGEVPGHLGWDTAKASYRMSEHEGDLRVVSFTGQTGWWGGLMAIPLSTSATSISTATSTSTTSTTNATTATIVSPATLSILREAANQKLVVVGSLPNAQQPQPIGKPGEQVYAVKFIGSRAYVVTFRRTDPLYVLDLSNPTQPKAVGELQLPGFSDYLYPISDALLLGVGKDASDTGAISGVKLALINVGNPAAPVVNSQIIVGLAGSSSALDFSPQGINIFSQNGVQRIALPITVYEPGLINFFGTMRMGSKMSSMGLYRFEVDTKLPSAQAKLVSRSVVGEVQFDQKATNGFDYFDYQYALPYNKRSLQIDADVYYFDSRQFLRAVW